MGNPHFREDGLGLPIEGFLMISPGFGVGYSKSRKGTVGKKKLIKLQVLGSS